MSNKKKLQIVSLLKDDVTKTWKKITSDWDKYFQINHVFSLPTKIKNFINKKIDILFIDSRNFKDFKFEYHEIFKNKEQLFKLIVIKKEQKLKDWIFVKNLADDIIFLNNEKLAKWKSLANLRRYWTTYSKPTIIIYKGIIVDFINNFVSVEGVEKSLTTKEFFLLKYFIENLKKFISKEQIFKKIWQIDDKDSTRVVDQILFKLKQKIGKEYFVNSKHQGIKFQKWK